MPRSPLCGRRRLAAIATSVTALGLVAVFGVASARNDDGSRSFFLLESLSPRVAVDAAPSVQPRQHARSRPLEIRRVASVEPRPERRRRKTAPVMQARKIVAPQPGPVTLFTDQTLQRGDAVMTVAGIRIFNGGTAFPHVASDFSKLDGADGIPRSVARTLIAMNNMPLR